MADGTIPVKGSDGATYQIDQEIVTTTLSAQNRQRVQAPESDAILATIATAVQSPPAVGAPGSGVPTSATLVGGSNGGTLYALNVDANGRQIVVGAAASGSGVSGNPVMVGGSDGTNAHFLSTDSSGRPNVNVNGTVLVSAASLPLPSGAAQDGTDGTGITAPTGGVGIRGWLSGIYSLFTSGTQKTQIVSAGGNVAAVDSTGVLLGKGNRVEFSGLSAGALNASLFPATDMSDYKTFSLQIQTSGTGTLTIQGNNDNGSNWYSCPAILSSNLNGLGVTTVNSVGLWYGPVFYRYMRIVMTAYTSGTFTGLLEAFTFPIPMICASGTVAQSGTWTVQPGNTPNTSPWVTTVGGTATTAVAAGTSANTVVKNAAGHLATVLVTATGTNALTIYDNASTNSGTIIGYVAASAAAGTIVNFGMPAANGITVAGNSSNPGVTISFSA